jgi:hypothetical protein
MCLRMSSVCVLAHVLAHVRSRELLSHVLSRVPMPFTECQEDKCLPKPETLNHSQDAKKICPYWSAATIAGPAAFALPYVHLLIPPDHVRPML